MKWFLSISVAFLAFGDAHAESTLFPKTYGEVEPAEAPRRFCEKFPEECTPSIETNTLVKWTPKKWKELQRINREVNDTMISKTDFELYGVDENWTLNEKEGDCEDFAILKRQRLIKLGWPAGALLITVVEPLDDLMMHAVLAVRTSRGDFILDNKLKDGSTFIWRWDEIMAYTYVAQQSPVDPHRWLSLIPLPNTNPRFERWVTSK